MTQTQARCCDKRKRGRDRERGEKRLQLLSLLITDLKPSGFVLAGGSRERCVEKYGVGWGVGGVGGIHVVVWFRRICDVTVISLRASYCCKWGI